MKISARATASPLMAAGLIAAMASPAFSFVNLAPHRAVYDLELKSARERSGVKGLQGRMVIEIVGSKCEGWSVNIRLVNAYQLPVGKQRLIDTRTTSWESGDGLKMTYLEKEYIDNLPFAVTRLTASRTSSQVKQRKPKQKTFAIPKDTIFPIAHQMRLIEKAMAGVGRDKSTVYDGSDHDKIYQAITFIGKKKTPAKSSAVIKGGGSATLLNNISSWPVSISYYLLRNKKDQDTPSQQISFVMFANGIAGDLVIDYGEFAMKGKLTYLEKLPQAKCE